MKPTPTRSSTDGLPNATSKAECRQVVQYHLAVFRVLDRVRQAQCFGSVISGGFPVAGDARRASHALVR